MFTWSIGWAFEGQISRWHHLHVLPILEIMWPQEHIEGNIGTKVRMNWLENKSEHKCMKTRPSQVCNGKHYLYFFSCYHCSPLLAGLSSSIHPTSLHWQCTLLQFDPPPPHHQHQSPSQGQERKRKGRRSDLLCSADLQPSLLVTEAPGDRGQRQTTNEAAPSAC